MASGSRKVVYAALAGNTLIAATKFAASAMTGSSAMLSEGIHSLVDTGNQVLLLLGLRRAAVPPDARFPFGHGKEIYFWSFVVAISIFGVGAGVSLYEGIHHVLSPRPMESPFLNYAVLGIAAVFETGSWLVALREFRAQKGARGYLEAVAASKDPTVLVVLFEDSAALAGLLVAFAGVALADFTGRSWFDAGASIVIGLILATTAGWLARETMGLLVGESASAETVAGIRALACAPAGVEAVNEVLTLHMGPAFVLVNVSVDFDDALPAGAVEDAVAAMSAAIRSRFPEVKRVFVEARARADRARKEEDPGPDLGAGVLDAQRPPDRRRDPAT